MTSGFGLRGGLGRCYHFWADFKECKVRMNRSQIIELLEGTATENRDGTIGIYRALILLKSRHYFLATGIIRRRKELALPLSLTHSHTHTNIRVAHMIIPCYRRKRKGCPAYAGRSEKIILNVSTVKKSTNKLQG